MRRNYDYVRQTAKEETSLARLDVRR
jgi:hypothetical protein